MMLSVICPTYNEKKYIAHCIESVLAQDYPKEDLEVLFVDGMSNDGTRDVIESYSVRYPYMRLVDNPKKIIPYAMNIGIAASRGNIILRLDAHALYPENYFSVLTRRLVELDADNVGTVCHTDVLNKTPKTLAIREVLSNRFGVGNSLFRIGVDKVMQVDTVPFGCWRRETFDKYGMYDTRLVRNQDIELNKRILRGGGLIFLIPDCRCTYLARETYKALAKNNFGNGKWNVLTVYYTGDFKSLSLRHFVPLAFVLSLLLPCIVAPFWHPAVWVAVASLLSYIMLFSVISARLAISKELSFIRLMIAFAVLHISYGCGSIAGLCTLPFKRKGKC